MKIEADFTELFKVVERIGAAGIKTKPITVGGDSKPRQPVIIDTPPTEETLVTTDRGLLGIGGSQVVLYMPKQWKNVKLEQLQKNGNLGYKFHLTECSVIHKMKQKNEFHRYIACNETSGSFPVTAVNSVGVSTEGEANLKVCKVCLSHLNYQGCDSGEKSKSTIVSDFDLAAFFASQSTGFNDPPPGFNQEIEGYTADWSEISKQYRASKDYCCEQCNVDLNNHKYLLHCHHEDRDKQNNNPDNLSALCVDCHRKQPFHDRVYLSKEHMEIITQLRNAQHCFNGGWTDALELADSAFNGILLIHKKANYPAPEIGFDICDEKQAVVATAEIAWPNKAFAIVHDDDECALLQRLGWQAMTLGQALSHHNNDHRQAA